MQNMSTHQALGGAGVEFDTRKFFWIGNTTDTPNVINSWHTTGIQTIQDAMARELVVGAPGTATASVYYPKALNELVGTKFKIVTRLSGRQRRQPGDGARRGRRPRSNSWASWKATKPDWLREKKIFILVQIRAEARSGACRHSDRDRARQDRRGQGGDDVPVGRHPDQPRLCDHAGRTGRARAGAAPRLRRHHEGPAVHRRGGEAQHGHEPVDRRRGAALLGPDRQHAGAESWRGRKAIIESK